MKITKNFNQLSIICVLMFTGCCTTGRVPVGSVIDWYRPNDTFPIPENYMIADGSTVTDPGSPLYNEALPDLRAKFVRGASTINEIGTSGGYSYHAHDFSLPTVQTSDVVEPKHRHTWAKFNKGTNVWSSWEGANEKVLADWGDGLDSEGSGVWPLGFDQEHRGSGTSTIFLTTQTQDGITVHHHNVEFSDNISTQNSSTEPPYIVLLKIVRIK